MAMPVIKGVKSEGERFPGADDTLCIEAMMQDRKALQAGTSHFLGQNFSKSSDIRYLDENGERVYAWTTSWGVSTRLIGALVMTHSDDDGLILPPKLAPAHVVILPVLHKEESRAQVLEYCEKLKNELQDQSFGEDKLVAELDTRDMRGGEKAWQWIKRGIPLRLEVGPRDIESDSVFVGRRDKGPKEKESISRETFVSTAAGILQEIQDGMLQRAKNFREEHTQKIDNADDFRAFFTPKNVDKPEAHGGFALTHWAGTGKDEDKLAKELKVTLRCMPLDAEEEGGTCPFTGKPSKQRVVFAKAY